MKEMKVLRFIKNGEQIAEYPLGVTVLDKSNEAIKAIIKHQPLDFSYVLGEEKDANELFTLKVNVKKSGAIYFMLSNKDFNKEEVFNKIFELRKMKSSTQEEVEAKAKALLEIVKELEVAFALYVPKGKFELKEDFFKEEYPLLIVKYDQDEDEEEEKNEENAPKEKEKLTFKKAWEKAKWLFSPLSKNYFHYISALVAAILTGFVVSIGVYNAFLGNMICIFFFVCALLAVTLNFFIYFDFFKKNIWKSRHFAFSVVISLAAALIGYVLFKLYFNVAIQKLEVPVPSIKKIAVISMIVAILFLTISAGIGYYIRLRKKKKKLEDKEKAQ